MSEWIAKFREADEFWTDELRICIKGDDVGFLVLSEDGTEFPIGPFFTEEDAIEGLRIYSERLETFEWL